MPWQCQVCTLVNTDDNNRNCNLCGKPKGTPDPDAGNEAMNHMSLRAILKAGPEAFDAEIREMKRMEALKQVKGVFGVVLNTETPLVVCDCIAFIRAKGMYTEGIFRIPGQQDLVDALKHKYSEEKEEDVLNSLPCEVHDVATLLKSFFRWLPEPIIPKENYEPILGACRTAHGSSADLENAVFSALSKVQSPNRECFSLIVSFLREVAQFEKYNKMSPVNLATCFAPSILVAPDDVSPEQALMDMSPAIGVLVVLIRSERRLFMPAKEQIKASTKHKPRGVLPPPPGLGAAGDKEKRRSSKSKFANMAKPFNHLGRRNSKDQNGEKRRSSHLKSPPGLGPPIPPKREDKNPPPMPTRREHRLAKPKTISGVQKDRRKKAVPIDIDDKI